jgi:hypothetical protein
VPTLDPVARAAAVIDAAVIDAAVIDTVTGPVGGRSRAP